MMMSAHRAVRAVRGRGGRVLRRRSHRSGRAAPRRQVSVRPGTGEVARRQHPAVGARHRAARRVEAAADRRLVMMVVQVRVVHLDAIAVGSLARDDDDIFFARAV